MSDLRTAAKQALDILDSEFTTVDGEFCRWCDGRLNAKHNCLLEQTIKVLRAALAEPGSDYENGFVDGMLEQARRSVDKAVNAMAKPIIKPEIKDDKPVPPPEAQTEAEKVAYCAGWWDALAAERKELLRIAKEQQ